MKTVHLLLLLPLCLAAGSPAAASNPKVDSLKQLLQSHQAIDKAEVLWGIAYELFDVDNPQALFYAERAYHEVWPRGDSLQIVKIGTTYGQLLRRVGRVDKSIEVSSQLLPVSRRHDYRKYTKMLLNSLSMSAIHEESNDKALEYCYESLEMRKNDKDSSGILVALSNLGFIYYKLRNCTDAIRLLEEALRYAGPKDSINTMFVNFNLGASYSELGKCEIAKVYYWKALRFNMNRDEQGVTSDIYRGFAYAHLKCGSLDSSRYYASLAVKQALGQMNTWSLILGYTILTSVEIRERNFAKGSYFLNSADSISKLTNYPALKLEILRQRARLSAATGDVQHALTNLDSYLSFDDSLELREASSRLREVEVRQAQKENIQKLEMQSSILELKDRAIWRQKVFLITASGLLICVIVLLVELGKAYQKKKYINAQLDSKVVERTQELGKERDILQHHLDEQKFLRLKTSRDLSGLTNSLLGLINLIKLDSSGDHGAYIVRVEGLIAGIRSLSDGLVAERKVNNDA